jgi:hypothetical protein
LLTVVLALAQAAAPAPETTPLRRASTEWLDCVQAHLDADMQSRMSADRLVTQAIARCEQQLEAMRVVIAAEHGEELSRRNIEGVRSNGRFAFLAYVARERGTEP